MAFLVSPGVQVKETDLTNIIPAVSTSIGGFAGIFEWGPALEVTQVSSEQDLISKFGYPNTSTVAGANTRLDWYSAANFLGYSGNLQVVRALAEDAKNASSEADSEIFSITVTLDSDIASADGANVKVGNYTVALVDGDTQNTLAGKLATLITAETIVTATATANVISFQHTVDHYSASDFDADVTLPSGTKLKVVATETEGFEGVQIANGTEFDNNSASLDNGSVYARYAGSAGNSLGVILIDSSVADSDFKNEKLFGDVTASSVFDTKPATSVWAQNLTGLSTINDEVHVLVYTTDDQLTGTKGEILESYQYLSKAKNGKTADSGANYYVDVVNSSSKYVYLKNESTSAYNAVTNAGSDLIVGAKLASSTTGAFETFKAKKSVQGVRINPLKGGADGSVLTDGSYTAAWDKLNDVETVDVSLLFAGKANGSKTVQKHIIDIAEKRKDCVAFISPDEASAVLNPTADKVADYYNNSVNGFNSTSYAFFDSGWKRQYDRYNDEYFWIPLNADTAGLSARSDATNEAWFSPAGLNRGFIQNSVKLSFNPDLAARDTLYTQRVNPVVTFRGQGTLLYGDKTALSRPSAFDRINVRRLFITLEKAIATAAKYQLFEFNDDLTRRTFVNAVEPFLADIKSRRGMSDFKVVCDTSNNTAEVIDSNRFVANIYIKPNRSINFITLNFVAVRSGVSFSEVAGV